ncbi:MAG: NAD(P)H-hydrate epimerase, partial [Rubripirellula sp.]
MNDANPLSHRQPPDRRLLPALNCDQVRLVDEIAINTYGMPSIILMENAGRGAAELIHQQSGAGKIIILCGIGNNGGDGYVIGRHLRALDREVEIVS